MSKLLQEAEMYRRKLARAKRIARFRRRRQVDEYIKSRIYMILMISFSTVLALILVISIMAKYNGERSEVIDSQAKMFHYMEHIIADCSEDSLLKTNTELVYVIDSLQIMLFAYNRRHQSDQKAIQYLTAVNNKKKKPVRLRVIPEDSTLFVIEEDTTEISDEEIVVEDSLQ